jgi:glycine cleavage system H protein
MAAMLILLTIILCLTLDTIAEARKARRAEALAAAGGVAPLRPMARLAEVPASLTTPPVGTFLAPGHTWLQVEPAGIARVGVGQLPVTLLGKVDRLKMLPRGTEVREGDELAVLSHGVREIRLRAPISGTVSMVNRGVALDPRQLNENPFGKQWLYRIRPQELRGSLKRCRSADAATRWMKQELRRLRDFLSVAPGDLAPGVSLPDGGLPVEGLASALGADQWARLVEEFFEAKPKQTIQPRS